MSNLDKPKPYGSGDGNADGRDYTDGAGYCSGYGNGDGSG